MTSAAALARDVPKVAPSPIRPLSTPPRLSIAAAPAPWPEPGTIIPRTRLLEQLDGAGRVVVVSAPPGSGKTALLRSWIREAGLVSSAGWLPMEHLKPDPQRFWLSVLHALRRTEPGSALLREVPAAPDFDGWAFVERLLADLAQVEDRLWLIIDELDELDCPETLRQFEVLLARAPVELRFALSTRCDDLPLGLHRIRLDGDLTELRGTDLRFGLNEAQALFEAFGVDLPEAGLALLVERTEGWAAGLRLAAIALARHPDPERFVTEFSGSERTVAGYLRAEVLERQPAEVRELLLRTSVLDRVSGPLADHVAGCSGSERIFQELEDANAFVTSVDARRSWFRPHRLFAELLQLELRRTSPAIVDSLHRAAAQWFEQEGYQVEAVRHAQAARAWQHAARLLLDTRIGLSLDGHLATVRELLDRFPACAAAEDPELALAFAGVRLREGSFDQADGYLLIAERHAEDIPEDRRRLFGLHLASVRLALARQRGDLSGALEAMRSLKGALAAQPPGAASRTDDIHALALMTLGATELWALQLGDARRHLEEGLALARRIGRPYLEIGCLAHLAIAAPLSGRSASVALDFTEKAVAIAQEHGLATNPIVALAFAVGSCSLAWLGRFEEAEEWLKRGDPALHPEGDPGTEVALCHARGLLYSGQGRLPDALAAFRRAEKMQARLVGEHALTADVRARIVLTQVRMGDLADARAALASIAEQDRDRAEVRIPTAAVHLAEGSPARVVELLAPVTERSVESLIPTWAAIHALILEAVGREQLGETRGAEASLERALDLAEPEGLILPFTITPVEALLERYPRHRTAHAAFLSTIRDVRAGRSAKPRGECAPLLDELSAAELRVIRYLPTNLKAPEVAAELFVSTNTVRTHLRHIYAKLGVHGRAGAVARARELGLLAPSHRHAR